MKKMVFGYIKELIIGISLIFMGILSFLLLIPFLNDFMSDTPFLNLLIPGEWIFQVILIALGILVMFKRISFRTTH